MKKRLIKFLASLGWWRLAYRISPGLAHYYAGTLCAEGLTKGLKEGLARPVKIAFIGYNNRLTANMLRQFVLDNEKQVIHFDPARGQVRLRDGTTIQAVTSPIFYRDGVRYDQVLLADDRRMRILYERRDELAWLRNVTAHSEIPEEFRFLVYDIDADIEKEEKPCA